MFKAALFFFLTTAALSAFVYFNHNFEPRYDDMMASVVRIEGSESTTNDPDDKGAGVILDNGYIVTVNHLIGDNKKFEGSTKNGEKFDLTVIKQIPNKDIAILKAPPSFDVSKISASLSCDGVVFGQRIISMGNPIFFDFITTYGKVAGLRRVGLPPEVGEQYKDLDIIVTDISMAQGMSGGPVFDLDGNVVGLNEGILVAPMGKTVFGEPLSSLTGISMAVSGEAVCDALKDLIGDSKVPISADTPFGFESIWYWL